VELLATFQDADNVFMVMEFLQGGDLIGHVMQKGRLSKEVTTFYMAELVEALDTVHKCGYVHRDVKPDNMVLTSGGHLKLLDFGLCKHDAGIAADASAAGASPNQPRLGTQESSEWKKKCSTAPKERRAQLKSVVGTPQYMAPEVYRGASGIEADLWSVGIITFECLVGCVPFHAGDLDGIQAARVLRDKITRHQEIVPAILAKAVEKQYFSAVSKQFLQGLLCERQNRLTAEGCRSEPLFTGLDFAQLHLMTPPIVPRVSAAGDASYFDEFDPHQLPTTKSDGLKDASLNWAHYEFDREAYEFQRPALEAKDFFGAAPNRRSVQKHR
jgi:serine/threonine protein kinase